MSDPVTNVELEDVLSSIRRLVADRDEPPVPLRPARSEPDRFLLTPALRVAPVTVAEPVPAANRPDPVAATPESVTDPVLTSAMSDDVAGAVARLAARIEAAVTVQDSDFEPDGSEEVPVMDWSTPMPEDAPVFRSRQPAPLRLTPEMQEPAQPVFQHRGYDRVEQVVEAEDWDAAQIDLTRDLARTARADREDDDLDPAIAALFGQDALIDEDMLRNMIVEIVRQELQGTLGERITRNVRKLVRREIFRVLSSQEFE